MARAIKGGEIGANGEFYKGGQFLNTVPENAKREGSRPRGPRKEEIAPYRWEVRPEGMRALMTAMKDACQWTREGLAVVGPESVFCFPGRRNFYRISLATAQAMADRFNAGERWIPEADFHNLYTL